MRGRRETANLANPSDFVVHSRTLFSSDEADVAPRIAHVAAARCNVPECGEFALSVERGRRGRGARRCERDQARVVADRIERFASRLGCEVELVCSAASRDWTLAS